MGDAMGSAQNDLTGALLHLVRAQVTWCNRPDVTADLLRAAATVADALDLVLKAQVTSQTMPPPTPEKVSP